MTWTLPPRDLLARSQKSASEQATDTATAIIEGALGSLGVPCEVKAAIHGPQVSRYEVEPQQGVSVRRYPATARDLAYELEAERVLVTAPLPGRRAVGIDVPRKDRQLVKLADVLDHAAAPTTATLGVDMHGDVVSCDLRTTPHMLIAGTTGGGKSVLLHTIICSLLAVSTPAELSLLMIDTKQVELTAYEHLPHLIGPVVDDAWEAVYALEAVCELMEERYAEASAHGARTLAELNERLPEKDRYPYLVVVVDELADLMVTSKHDVERAVVRIAQKARAVGIHLVMATQSPRVQVVTGILKANLPSRIALSTASALDSRVIFDRNGAETLLGRGDALYHPITQQEPTRMQSALVTSEEVSAIVNHWSSQAVTQEFA